MVALTRGENNVRLTALIDGPSSSHIKEIKREVEKKDHGKGKATIDSEEKQH